MRIALQPYARKESICAAGALRLPAVPFGLEKFFHSSNWAAHNLLRLAARYLSYIQEALGCSYTNASGYLADSVSHGKERVLGTNKGATRPAYGGCRRQKTIWYPGKQGDRFLRRWGSSLLSEQ